MSKLTKWIFPLALLAVSSGASADPWKDESGKGRHGDKRGEYKEEYWGGNCKVERKYEKNEYKEERKCRRPDRHADRDYRYRQPAQAEYPYREPGRVRYPSPNYDPRATGIDIDMRVRQ